MGLFREFKQFAVRGSAVEMGVGMVLGAAFSGFIDSLVTDMLLPPIGLVYASMNFESLFINLSGGYYPTLAAAKEAGAATINYGMFISATIRFIIVMFAVFMVVRQINRWKKPHRHPMDAMTKKECPYCCMPIPSQAVICPNCSSSLSVDQPRWRVK
ncbi:large conductance mechanosensitive channel protein MscL [Halobacillus litoralis]|uniref:large conductance mechanosensitive channel protein MscL n=1 Tax=Halobacillus litoralis TaxID=45668 RepID=UPI001CD79CDC|nr:large conductance mechanosensitive channel protein MscL [Halobacillus litoralis]MCA0972516.1 large conductance mechanosensitive channel protein MscL [Halobacillus litoralis]